MAITNIQGDLLKAKVQIRCHQVNCRGAMGAGIAKQIRDKYPEVYDPYKALCKQFGAKLLGEVQFCACHDGTVIANLFAQDDWATDRVQTNMQALEECLQKVAAFAAKMSATVGVPRLMGAGLAGGDWTQIESLIEKYLPDCTIVEKLPEEKTTTKPKTKEKPKVTIYTDGSCSGNPGPGGWGAILMMGAYEKELSGYAIETTNNRMELTGVISALSELRTSCKVTLYTDSAYVVNSVNKGWIEGWKAKGWTKKGGLANADLWPELDKLLKVHDVTFIWVEGHASNEYNNRCDRIAVAATKKAKTSLYS